MTAPRIPAMAPPAIDPLAPPTVAPDNAPETRRAPNCIGTRRLGVVGNWSTTSSTSASSVNTHGVHVAPMKASQVPFTSRRPRRAAQLAAAGAVNVRDPATMPMSSAKKYAVTSHLVYEAGGPSIAEAPHHHLPRIRR